MAIARNRSPVLAPVTGLTLSMSVWAMFSGLKRIQGR
jgi:1,2-diacylglycerol 3-beta-glucosyltransferase